jgi:uncharacterized pyridoxal phosphate-containing UPF0001 family protein
VAEAMPTSAPSVSVRLIAVKREIREGVEAIVENYTKKINRKMAIFLSGLDIMVGSVQLRKVSLLLSKNRVSILSTVFRRGCG